jgi:hypothetical protein
MKKLLTILSLLITSVTFAQQKYVIKVQGQPGIYGLANNGTGDSLIFYSQGVRHAIKVTSNADLSNYYTKSEVDSLLADSIDVAKLKGGKIDTSHIPVSNIYIQQAGAGETRIVRAGDDTTLLVATLKNSDDIIFSKDDDSSIIAGLTSPKLNISDTAAMLASLANKADKANPAFTGVVKINSDTLATKADVRASAGGGGSFHDLSGRNYASDSLAVTVGGLGLYDLYRNESDVKIVSKLPDLTANQFKWTIDNSADEAAYSFIIYSSDFNMNVVVDWGDGTTSNFNGAKTYTPSHSYGTEGTYTIKAFVDDLTKVNQLYLNSNNRNVTASNFTNFSNLSNLLTLSLVNLNMSSADTISYPASLTALDLYANNNTGFVTPVNLTSLSNLDIGGNFINTSSLATTLVLPASLTTLDGEYIGGWGVSNLNAMLVYLDGLTFTNPVDFDFAGNGAPTGTGATAKASLITKGNTVETD